MYLITTTQKATFVNVIKMQRQVKNALLLMFILGFWPGATTVAQVPIWPGDISNNGEVNQIDVLYWGHAYGTKGPLRQHASTEWQKQIIAFPWIESFPDGTNYAYADANGDGRIDENDLTDAIKANYRRTWGSVVPDGIRLEEVGSPLPLKIETDKQELGYGDELNITLSLGDAQNPVIDFQGVAFSLQYDPELVKSIIGRPVWVADWLQPSKDNRFFFHHDEALGRIDVAVVNLDGERSTGYGPILNITIVVEDIILGLRKDDTLRLETDEILMLNSDFSAHPVTPDKVNIDLRRGKKLVTSTDQAALDNLIRVYPNPVHDRMVVESESDNEEILDLQLFDLSGRQMSAAAPLPVNGQQQVIFDTTALPQGIYWLQIVTDKGKRTTQRIVKIN